MKTLSLFDGISCGRQALERLGITPEVYYASEVEPQPIALAAANFPDTIHLGDVRNIDPAQLGHIDLLLGGSPCQSFSMAGKQNGMSTKTKEDVLTLDRYLQLKAEKFEFEGQSYLFWEYVRILTGLRKVNPNIRFLLENVRMTKKWQDVLSEALGCEPVVINSRLLSAQNRHRLYWVGGIEVPQPDDKGLLLRDVLTAEPVKLNGTYTPHESAKTPKPDDVGCNEVGHAHLNGHDFLKRVYAEDAKSPTLTAICGGNQERKLATPIGYATDKPAVGLFEQTKRPSLTVIRTLEEFTAVATECKATTVRIFRTDAEPEWVKLEDLTSVTGEYLAVAYTWRKLTVTECERLQTVADGYTSAPLLREFAQNRPDLWPLVSQLFGKKKQKYTASTSARYKALGNGWTVDVIAHIFKHIL